MREYADAVAGNRPELEARGQHRKRALELLPATVAVRRELLVIDAV